MAARLYAKVKEIPIESIASGSNFKDTEDRMVGKAYNLGIVSGISKGIFHQIRI